MPRKNSNAQKDSNTNCLDCMQCPSCKSLEPFHITATARFLMFDSGEKSYEDLCFTSESRCVCAKCNHVGTVQSFEIPAEPPVGEHP